MSNEELIALWRQSGEPNFMKWLEKNEGLLSEIKDD